MATKEYRNWIRREPAGCTADRRQQYSVTDSVRQYAGAWRGLGHQSWRKELELAVYIGFTPIYEVAGAGAGNICINYRYI